MSERAPCKCHGSWPLHADDQAAALREQEQVIEQQRARIAELERVLERLHAEVTKGASM